MGLHQAGYTVVGVDIDPQPRYPFTFYQADALTFPLHDYDFVWASPICKKFSSATRTSKTQDNWPDQIAPIRKRLQKWGGKWCIENVPGAPLVDPMMLCGAMFGLKTYRHRLFETSFNIEAPTHPNHKAKVCKMGRPPKKGEFINPVGHFSGVEFAKKALGIDWMTRDELSQSIPPAYAKYIAGFTCHQIIGTYDE